MQLATMIWTMDALLHVLTQETEQVNTAIIEVGNDCHMFTTLQYNTADILQGQVYQSITEFQTLFHTNVITG